MRLAMEFGNITNVTFCSFVSFCDRKAVIDCLLIPIKDCRWCSNIASNATVAIVVFIALLAILGNLLVILSVFNISKKYRTKLDFVKCSLAFADIITGLDLAVVAVPSIFQIVNSSASELHRNMTYFSGQWATLGGTATFFIYLSTLHHLLYMSFLRFLAVKFPFQYKMLSERKTVIHLIVIWCASLISASVPGWRTDHVFFAYDPVIFNYFVRMEKDFAASAEVIVLASLMFVPYTVMTLLVVITAATSLRFLRRSNAMQVLSKRSKRKQRIQKEIRVYKMTLWMYIGFSLAFVPMSLVILLFYTGMLTCETVSTPLLVSYILSSTTALLNVLIYSLRDPSFHEGLSTMFSKTSTATSRPLLALRSAETKSPRTFDETSGKHVCVNHVGNEKSNGDINHC